MRRVIVFGISISSAILHFVIGGFAVALASIMADKVGGKLGGIIATMPAVYLAAIIALAIDHKGPTYSNVNSFKYRSDCWDCLMYCNSVLYFNFYW